MLSLSFQFLANCIAIEFILHEIDNIGNDINGHLTATSYVISNYEVS